MASNQQEQEYESQLNQGVAQAQQQKSISVFFNRPASKMDGVDLGLGLVVAIIFDAINIIIPSISLVGIALLWMWLWFKGVVGIGSWGIGTSIVGAIPGLGNVLPETVAFVVAAYIIAKSPVKLPTKSLSK